MKTTTRKPITARSPAFWIGWGVMTLAAVGIGLYSVPPYVTGNVAANRIPLNPEFALHFLWISLHAVPGVLALMLGPFQFVPAFRNRYPKAHRVIGIIYLLSILVGSVMGVVAAFVSTSGLAAQIGFLLLAITWFYSALLAYRAARRHQYNLHRVWMIRNYSLTFAAVLLRAFLGIGIFFMSRNPVLTFEQVYTSSVWASIFVSYIIAEWFIVQPSLNRTVQKSTVQKAV